MDAIKVMKFIGFLQGENLLFEIIYYFSKMYTPYITGLFQIRRVCTLSTETQYHTHYPKNHILQPEVLEIFY